MVAARLQKETSYVMLLLRWVGCEMPSEDDRSLLQRISDKSISAVQPTVLLVPAKLLLQRAFPQHGALRPDL